MPLALDRSFDLLASNPAHYHCTTDAPLWIELYKLFPMLVIVIVIFWYIEWCNQSGIEHWRVNLYILQVLVSSFGAAASQEWIVLYAAILHCTAILARVQPKLMKWSLVWIMPQLQNRSLDMLTCSAVSYQLCHGCPIDMEDRWAITYCMVHNQSVPVSSRRYCCTPAAQFSRPSLGKPDRSCFVLVCLHRSLQWTPVKEKVYKAKY